MTVYKKCSPTCGSVRCTLWVTSHVILGVVACKAELASIQGARQKDDVTFREAPCHCSSHKMRRSLVSARPLRTCFACIFHSAQVAPSPYLDLTFSKQVYMPQAVSLPEDVWIHIAHFATVKAIAALSDVCTTRPWVNCWRGEMD
jgi:hypothetical protein